MKAKPGAEYGYHYCDGGAFFAECDTTPWGLIDQVVAELAEDEVSALRIGEVIVCGVRDILDREKVLDLVGRRPLTVERLLEYIGEAHGEDFTDEADAEAFLAGDERERAAAVEEFKNLVASIPARFRDSWESRESTEDLEHVDAVSLGKVADEAAERIVEWAEKHVELSPPQYCCGIFPLPVELVDGEWHYGREKGEEPPASITIDCDFFLTDDLDNECRWQWKLASGATGECASLEEAMKVSHLELTTPKGDAPGPEATSPTPPGDGTE